MSVFTDAPFEIVTKPEAARRQLATAIRLCLAGGDAVSIRTLACAAHEILTVLVATKGGRSLLLDNPLYSAEMKKGIRRGFKGPYNFFKHADRDAGARLRFRPLLVEGIIADAIFMYGRVTGHYFPEAIVYILYFFTVYASEFGDLPLVAEVRKRFAEMEEPPRARKDFHLLLPGEQPDDTVDPRGPKGTTR
jgi:hypothetical protein